MVGRQLKCIFLNFMKIKYSDQLGDGWTHIHTHIHIQAQGFIWLLRGY